MAISEFTELDLLQQTLNSALNTFKEELALRYLPPLSSTATSAHPLDRSDYLPSTKLYEARRLALACVGQLKHLLQPPFEKVVEQSFAVYDTAALDAFVQTGVVDILTELSPQSVHVEKLTVKVGVGSDRLTTILRYLTTHGWVRECQEGCFALNRPALELANGRNGRKWALTPGKPEVAASLVEWLLHPEWRFSHSNVETAFQLGNHTNLSIFDWLKDRPDTLEKWANSVQAIGDVQSRAILEDYPWETMECQTIVDLGGGRGSFASLLVATFPCLKLILQDLPEVMPLARETIIRQCPSALANQTLRLESHDFFTRQPRSGNGYTYMFKHVLHDWPDSDVVKILTRISTAAGPMVHVEIGIARQILKTGP